MEYITNAAYKAWQQSLTQQPFADWLERQKSKLGLYWGA